MCYIVQWGVEQFPWETAIVLSFCINRWCSTHVILAKVHVNLHLRICSWISKSFLLFLLATLGKCSGLRDRWKPPRSCKSKYKHINYRYCLCFRLKILNVQKYVIKTLTRKSWKSVERNQYWERHISKFRSCIGNVLKYAGTLMQWGRVFLQI